MFEDETINDVTNVNINYDELDSKSLEAIEQYSHLIQELNPIESEVILDGD